MPSQVDDKLKKNWDAFNAAKEKLEAEHLGKKHCCMMGKSLPSTTTVAMPIPSVVRSTDWGIFQHRQ